MKSKDRIKILQEKVKATPDGIIGPKTLKSLQLWLQVSPVDIAHLMGNVHHETAGFTISEENMNYTSAARIRAVWPSRFPTLESAEPYVRNPVGLANKVYNGRMGNDEPLDGYNFRGRGAIQTTGKWSYQRLGDYVGANLVSNPEKVAGEYYWDSAFFYFDDRKLWRLVKGISEDDIRLIRHRINGGYNGLDDTRKWVQHYFKLLNS